MADKDTTSRTWIQFAKGLTVERANVLNAAAIQGIYVQPGHVDREYYGDAILRERDYLTIDLKTASGSEASAGAEFARMLKEELGKQGVNLRANASVVVTQGFVRDNQYGGQDGFNGPVARVTFEGLAYQDAQLGNALKAVDARIAEARETAASASAQNGKNPVGTAR